jgi:phage repressor protein C with HTH and peptisase S24 domain
MEDSLLVKRLTLHPVTRRVTVQSDNPAYADWPDLALSDIKLIGRVIWTGRRVA